MLTKILKRRPWKFEVSATLLEYFLGCLTSPTCRNSIIWNMNTRQRGDWIVVRICRLHLRLRIVIKQSTKTRSLLPFIILVFICEFLCPLSLSRPFHFDFKPIHFLLHLFVASFEFLDFMFTQHVLGCFVLVLRCYFRKRLFQFFQPFFVFCLLQSNRRFGRVVCLHLSLHFILVISISHGILFIRWFIAGAFSSHYFFRLSLHLF
mmetsp:Transcript_9929/g.20174  ORF Transcript_9929/g.20174 Transcript_9929/m.20174 type:complete len:206 (+) Transcript_9929:1692-2309(+)